MKENLDVPSLVLAAADNGNHNESTLSGKRSTHAKTSLLLKTPPVPPVKASARIPCVQERPVDPTTLPGTHKKCSILFFYDTQIC